MSAVSTPLAIIVACSVVIGVASIVTLYFAYRYYKLRQPSKGYRSTNTMLSYHSEKRSTGTAFNKAENLPSEPIQRTANPVLSTVTWTIPAADAPISLPGFLRINLNSDIISKNNESFGEGVSAKIVKGTLVNPEIIARNGDNPYVAIKFYRANANSSLMNEGFRYEVALMYALTASDYIVKFLGYSENPNAIVMRAYDCSLLQLLFSGEHKERMYPQLVIHLVTDIAKGMAEIHNLNVVHFDLKLENVLIEFSGRSMRCVICDFGFASVIGDQQRKRLAAGLDTPITGGFTLIYAAPEFLSRRFDGRGNVTETDKFIDVYAYGILLFEMMNRQRAWHGLDKQKIKFLVTSGQRPQISLSANEYYSSHFPSLLDCYYRCVAQEPNDRPQFLQILQLLSQDISSEGHDQ